MPRTSPRPRPLVWRISAEAPPRRGVDPAQAKPSDARPKLAEPGKSRRESWVTSSFDLLSGTDVIEGPDTLALRPSTSCSTRLRPQGAGVGPCQPAVPQRRCRSRNPSVRASRPARQRRAGTLADRQPVRADLGPLANVHRVVAVELEGHAGRPQLVRAASTPAIAKNPSRVAKRTHQRRLDRARIDVFERRESVPRDTCVGPGTCTIESTVSAPPMHSTRDADLWRHAPSGGATRCGCP